MEKEGGSLSWMRKGSRGGRMSRPPPVMTSTASAATSGRPPTTSTPASSPAKINQRKATAHRLYEIAQELDPEDRDKVGNVSLKERSDNGYIWRRLHAFRAMPYGTADHDTAWRRERDRIDVLLHAHCDRCARIIDVALEHPSRGMEGVSRQTDSLPRRGGRREPRDPGTQAGSLPKSSPTTSPTTTPPAGSSEPQARMTTTWSLAAHRSPRPPGKRLSRTSPARTNSGEPR